MKDEALSQVAPEAPAVDAPAPAAAPSPSMMGGAAQSVGSGMLLKKLAARRAAEEEAAAGGGHGGGHAGKEDCETHHTSEDAIADSGFKGERIGLPYQAEMERGYNANFGHIEAYAGPEAEHACGHLGAQAYTRGNKIAFASKSPPKEIVAHELAHTLQQSGGSAVKTFAAHSVGHLEAEADAAAETVTSGGQADIALTTGGGGIHKWGGSDHYALGNLGGQKALRKFRSMFPEAAAGLKTTTTDVVHGKNAAAANITPGDAKLTGGDGNMQVNKGEETLGINTGNKSKFLGFGKGAATSVSFGDASRYAGDYSESVDGLKGKNPGDLVGMTNDAQMVFGASTNANHFYPLNRAEYAGHHAKAVAHAEAGDLDGAMLEEGFAAHFLQDTFSSGHMAPRSLDSVEHMHNDKKVETTLDMITASIIGAPTVQHGAAFAEDAKKGLKRSKQWHDFFCALPNGLPTDKGRFHGDYYMDGNDLEHVSDVVSESLLEVLSATQKGKKVSYGVSAKIPTPSFSQIMADPIAGPAWKLMMNDYAADLAKAKSNLKEGEKGVTDGGTQYDSMDTLHKIEQNVFGEQPGQQQGFGAAVAAMAKKAQADGVAAAKDPIGFRAGKVNDLRATLLGSLGGLKHYLVAKFGFNVHLNLDDDVKSKSSDEGNWELGDLESKFQLVSNVEHSLSAYLDALGSLATTSGLDEGLKTQVKQEISFGKDLHDKMVEWKKWVADAQSFWTLKSTKQAYAKKMTEQIGPRWDKLQTFGALSPPKPMMADIGPTDGLSTGHAQQGAA